MYFDQIFAVVDKLMAFCVFFAIAVYYNLKIDQIDDKTTFLYGFID